MRRIADIVRAMREITGFVAGMTFAGFDTDRRTICAVAYDCIVIGEAARQVAEDMQQRHPEVPWSGMIGLRNIVAHQYCRLDTSLL